MAFRSNEHPNVQNQQFWEFTNNIRRPTPIRSGTIKINSGSECNATKCQWHALNLMPQLSAWRLNDRLAADCACMVDVQLQAVLVKPRWFFSSPISRVHEGNNTNMGKAPWNSGFSPWILDTSWYCSSVDGIHVLKGATYLLLWAKAWRRSPLSWLSNTWRSCRAPTGRAPHFWTWKCTSQAVIGTSTSLWLATWIRLMRCNTTSNWWAKSRNQGICQTCTPEHQVVQHRSIVKMHVSGHVSILAICSQRHVPACSASMLLASGLANDLAGPQPLPSPVFSVGTCNVYASYHCRERQPWKVLNGAHWSRTITKQAFHSHDVLH